MHNVRSVWALVDSETGQFEGFMIDGQPISLTEALGPSLGVKVTGKIAQGNTLTAKIGPHMEASGFQWMRNGAAISGATAATYTVQAGDVGQAITAKATSPTFVGWPMAPLRVPKHNQDAMPPAPGPGPVSPPPPPADPALTPGLVTFGDSVTEALAISAGNRWSNIRALELGLPLINQGISGTVMQNRADSGGSPRANNGRARYQTALLGTNKRSKYELLYGLNDLRYTAAPATMNLTNFIEDYRAVIDGLLNDGIPAANITIGSPSWLPTAGYSTGSAGFTGSSRTVHEQYIAALYGLAYQRGVKYAAVYERMRDNGAASLIDIDNIHPVTSGHAVIAQAFAAAEIPSTGVWSGSAADITAPTLTNATVSNSAPSQVAHIFDELLDTNSTPANSDFSVPGKTVSSVSVSGATVLVNVSVPFVNGDTITSSYTPGTNRIRDLAGNNAAAWTSRAVTNNVQSQVPAGTAAAVTFSSANASWATIATERYSSNTGTTAFEAIAQVTGSTTVGTQAWVEIQYPNNTDAGAVVTLDSNSGLNAYSTNLYLAQLVQAGTVLQSANSSGTTTQTGFAFSAPSATSRMRLHLAANGVVTIQTTTDDGSNWAIRHTFAAAATGTVYWRLYSSLQRDIYQPRQVGVA